MNTEHPTQGTPDAATTELPATTEPVAGPTEPVTEQEPAETSHVWSAANTPPATATPRVRSGTLVFGIVLALIGVWAIAAGFGLRVDAQLGIAGILVVAALGLLVAGVMRRGPSS